MVDFCRLLSITNWLAMADGESPQVVMVAIIKYNIYGGMNYLFNLEFNLPMCAYISVINYDHVRHSYHHISSHVYTRNC